VKSITLKIYERLLTEAKKNGNAEKREPAKKKLNNPEKEAPDDAILGNYAFANVRPGLPPEVNTEVEDDLEQELTTHFINNIHMSAKSGRALKTSLENDWYEKILSEPKQATVYRGLRVSEEWMIKNIGENWREQFDKTKLGQLKTNNMVLHPNAVNASSAVTSWTNSIKTAHDFANGPASDDAEFAVVCCAAIKDNPNQFIDSAAGLYGIRGHDEFADEQEVLGIGSIKVSQIICSRF
jgi:hypothetical protein